MSKLVGGSIGPEAQYDLQFVDGKLVMSVKYDGMGTDAEIKVLLEVDYFCDKLAEAIPGQIDDQIIKFLKAAFLQS